MSPLLVLALACAAVALLLFALSRIGRRRYEVIYCDAPAAPAQALVSRLYGIKGRPDSILRLDSGAYIPVERKSRPAPLQPYQGELIQVAAYGLLVEETYGSAPPYLRIEYSDRAVDIPFTDDLRRWVTNVAAEVRRARGTLPARSHTQRAKCRGCVQRENCTEAL
jgi:CRISPR-associated exonuclease Cas4